MPTMPRSQCNRFLSTLSLRRATQNALAGVNTNRISIHALLAESDIDAAVEVAHIRNFYPRSPCGERRWSLNQSLTSGLFLSTLSLRRATFLPLHTRQRTQISIHALLAESDKIRQTPQRPAHHFYPRSPFGERLRRCTMPTWPLLFLSTLSLRRATHGD